MADKSSKQFDKLLRKTNPGSSFTCSQKTLKVPRQEILNKRKCKEYHYASRTEKLLQIVHKMIARYGLINRGQCEAWKIRNYSNYNCPQIMKYAKPKDAFKNKHIQARHVANTTTNYDVQYRIYEQNVGLLPRKKYMEIQPRIKYLIDQDRPTKPSKLNYDSDEK